MQTQKNAKHLQTFSLINWLQKLACVLACISSVLLMGIHRVVAYVCWQTQKVKLRIILKKSW